MDPFHEGGNAGGVDLRKAGEAIMGAMKAVNPNAVWVVQAWGACPYPAMIKHLKNGTCLCLTSIRRIDRSGATLSRHGIARKDSTDMIGLFVCS